MAFDPVLIGTTANDGTGDPLRTAFTRVNSNFNVAVEGPATTPVADNTTVVFDSTSGRLVKQAGAAVAAEAGKFAPTGNITAGNGMYLPTTNTVAFSTNGAERMRIAADGKITASAGTNWVGTVAQSASSAVIERGSNANGEFVKFADGTMICHFSANVTDQAIDTAYGSIFQGVRVFTFPVAFVGNPTPHNGSGSWGTGASWAGVVGAASTTAASMRFWDVNSRSTGTAIRLQFSAVGRWY
jgi:hypothetical protein